MAAPSLLVPLPDASSPAPDFAAEASLDRVRGAAAIARDRIAEIDGVRVLGPEVKERHRRAFALRSTCATPAATPGLSPAPRPVAASRSTPRRTG